MPKIAQEILIFVGVVAMTCALLFFGYHVFIREKQTSQGIVDKADGVISAIVNDEVTQYQGTDITGSEVMNLIHSYDGEDFAILVTIGSVTKNYDRKISGSGSTGWTFQAGKGDGNLDNAQDISKTNEYINPTKTFKGAVLYDSAGNALGLHFTLN